MESSHVGAQLVWTYVDIVDRTGVIFVVGVHFFYQAEDGIRDLVRSRGLGDVYKRQGRGSAWFR